MREKRTHRTPGGDDFAIALVDITNLGDVMAFDGLLVEALRRPLQVAGKEMMVTTSVGIALRPPTATPRRPCSVTPASRSPAPRAMAASDMAALLRAEHGQGAATPAHGRA